MNAGLVDVADALNLEAGQSVMTFSEGDCGTFEYSEEEAGELFIDEEDLERAYAVLAAYKRDKEENRPVEPAIPTYEIGSITGTSEDTNDALAFLCEAQPVIQEYQQRAVALQKAAQEIQELLDLAKHSEKHRLPRKEFMRLLNQVKAKRQQAKQCWEVFKRGVHACKQAVGDERAAWAHYFAMDEEERHSYLEAYCSIDLDPYLVRNENEQEDMRKAREAIYGIKTEDANEDSRRQRTNLQLCDAHVAEQNWNGKWIHDCLDGRVPNFDVDLPVLSGGYVPPCRDVTDQYITPKYEMCDEEFQSLMASF